jgi:hypothetical protein
MFVYKLKIANFFWKWFQKNLIYILWCQHKMTTEDKYIKLKYSMFHNFIAKTEHLISDVYQYNIEWKKMSGSNSCNSPFSCRSFLKYAPGRHSFTIVNVLNSSIQYVLLQRWVHECVVGGRTFTSMNVDNCTCFKYIIEDNIHTMALCYTSCTLCMLYKVLKHLNYY